MKKRFSLSALTVAMLIGVFYTFIYCSVGTVDDSSHFMVNETSDEAVQVIASSDLQDEYVLPQSETTKSTTARTDIANSINTMTGEKINAANTTGKESYAVTSTKATSISTTAVYEATTVPKYTTSVPYTVPTTAATTIVTTTVPVTTTTVATTVKLTTAATTLLATGTTTVKTTTEAVKTEIAEFGAVTTTSTEKSTATSETPEPVTNTEDAGNLSYTLNGKKYTDTAYNVVCRMVQREMGPNFHEEALKAQAVATYSYMRYFNERGTAPTVKMSDYVSPNVSSAVSQVIGQGVYYNGSICQAVYSASSGGYSASAKDVWGNSVPYLVSVECEYDDYDPNYGYRTTISESRMRSMLESYLGISLSDNPEDWLDVLTYVDGNYVGSIMIDGQKTISGRTLREKVTNFELRSSKFTVTYSGGEFVFTTYGYGHGVGLSQNGANLYASKGGYNYVQILEHYYTGAVVK